MNKVVTMQFMKDWIIESANKAGLGSKEEYHLDGVSIDILAEHAFSSEELLAQIYIPYLNKAGIILLHKTIRTSLPRLISVNWYNVGLKVENSNFVLENYEVDIRGDKTSEDHQFKIEINKDGCVAKGSWPLIFNPDSIKGKFIKDFIPNEESQNRLIELFISGSLSNQQSISHRERIKKFVTSLFPAFISSSLENKRDFSPDKSYSLMHSAEGVILLIFDQLTPWVENEYRIATKLEKPTLVLAHKGLQGKANGNSILKRFDQSNIRLFEMANMEHTILEWLTTTFGYSSSLKGTNELIGGSDAEYEWDLFISHATEDKETFVRPLANALKERGLRIWYDETSLSLGDNLRRSIEHGLSKSRYGIVVISRDFLKKEWTQKELDGLFTRETSGEKVILPIWHQVDADFVRSYSPILANRIATLSSKGLDQVVKDILKAIKM